MLKRYEPEVEDRETEGSSLFPLRVENLKLKVDGRQLIDSIDLTLEGKHRTVIMGANGAGKSLLLRLLHGLIAPTSGSISWNGRPVDAEVQSAQALVFQRATMLRRSAEDNIRFVLSHLPRGQRNERVSELLSEAKLTHVATTPARLLSGGEQQRLAIARARARAPRVLFLDEPTASLDPASTHGIEEQISAIAASGTKIILVTHDLGQARRLADDVIFMHKGRVSETARAAAFFSTPKSAAAKAYLEGRLLL